VDTDLWNKKVLAAIPFCYIPMEIPSFASSGLDWFFGIFFDFRNSKDQAFCLLRKKRKKVV